MFTNLQMDTTYAFSVTECDFVTCTPYGPALTVHTNSFVPAVGLDLDTVGNEITTTTTDPLGNLSVVVTIPKGTPAGLHNLLAVVNDFEVASTPLDVTGLTFQPFVVLSSNGQIIGETGSQYPSIVSVNSSVTLNGYSFFPNIPVNITVDAVNGPALASVVTDATGTFIATFDYPGPTGDHSIAANQIILNQPYGASVNIDAETTQ